MRQRIFVVGHRNPDSDSVCSAIGYAYFKNLVDQPKKSNNTKQSSQTWYSTKDAPQTEGKKCSFYRKLYVACIAGPLNKETSYILERFELDQPLRLDSAAATVTDMPCCSIPIVANPDNSILDITHLIRDKQLRAVPIVDSNQRLVGVVDSLHLAVFYADQLKIEGLSVQPVQINLLTSALQGRVLANTGKLDSLLGDVFVADSQIGTMLGQVKKGDIAIAGDRTDVQIDLIINGCSALIITEDHPVSEEVLELARREEVLIISSPYSSFATANFVNLCQPVSSIMSRKVPTVKLHNDIGTVKEKIMESEFRLAMVLDDDQRLVGIITRSDLLDPIQKQMILVDHNEVAQAIADINEADIIEIIDHHRAGDISTVKPITIHCEPVGSTCTIVAEQIYLHQIDIAPDIAGALLAGILSDTLLLTLTTTTDKDHDIARRLAENANLNLADFGKELLEVSITTSDIPPSELVVHDFKEYYLLGKKIGVNQIMVLDEVETTGREAEIREEMRKLYESGNYNLLVMLITNPVTAKGEEIWVEGEKEIVEKAFDLEVKDGKCFVPKVMSRKKDFIPRLGMALRG